MKNIIVPFVSACLLLSACSMDEIPQASVDKETVFSNEKGLETYSYSFYNMLPSVTDGYNQDAMCDYGAVTNYDDFIRAGAYSPEVSSGGAGQISAISIISLRTVPMKQLKSRSATITSAWPVSSVPISIMKR